MPRRSPLAALDRVTLLTLPAEEADRIRVYSFSETDLARVRQCRRDANRFAFAVQPCLLRYPGVALAADRAVDDTLVHRVARAPWGSTTLAEPVGTAKIRWRIEHDYQEMKPDPGRALASSIRVHRARIQSDPAAQHDRVRQPGLVRAVRRRLTRCPSPPGKVMPKTA